MSYEGWMDRALELARQALGTTAPNPAVGAVIVVDGEAIGQGHTAPVGGPHAEIVAIEDALQRGERVRGATMYVTLEPCCHHGRTPPCTDRIVQEGVARVVVGVVDPFPPMRGNGLAQLREAGVEVHLGVRREACDEVVLGFSRATVHGLPEVTAKVASTLDGSIASASGASQWITGEIARRHGHGLRATHDAILVGIETVLADDPRLTCREGGTDPTPVVLDTAFRLPAGAALLRSSKRAVVITADDAPHRPELQADVLRVKRGSGGLDVEAALRALAARGLHRILVEGGARVHRSLLDAELVDRVALYLAPMVLPGGQRWCGGPAVADLTGAPRFGAPRVTSLGADLLLELPAVHRLTRAGAVQLDAVSETPYIPDPTRREP